MIPSLQQATVLDNPPSPLKLCSPSLHTQHDSDFEDTDEGDDEGDDEDNDEDESDEMISSSKTPQSECDGVTLNRLNGNSLVHEHVELCNLKHGVNAHGNRTFSKKLKKCPGGCMACLICKDEGKLLDECLIKMQPGKTTNSVVHLKTHKKCLDAQALAESEANKRKLKGKDKDQGGGKKFKTTELSSFFPSKVPSIITNKFQREIAEETNILTHEFIKNGAHSDSVADDSNFKE